MTLFDIVTGNFPSESVAGTRIAFQRVDLVEYLSGYGLQYVLRPEKGGSAVTVDAVVSGSAFQVIMNSGMTEGRWHWQAFLTQTVGGARILESDGAVTVKPDLTVNATDTRSHAQKTLDAINAVIENRAGADVSSYSIAGRSLTKMTVEELLQLQSLYQSRVDAETGNMKRNRIKVRF